MSFLNRLNRYFGKLIGLDEYYFPPGHFYTPLSSRNEIISLGKDFFLIKGDELSGINIDSSLIEERLDSFIDYYKEFVNLYCFGERRNFNVENGFYTYSDAIFLFCILRDYRPKRYFEVGSGFSSILTIETDLLCLGNTIEKKLIEPYPSERLLKLLKGDETGVEVISKKIQDVSIKLFESLERNDILFIDSSHVSKIGSDLNHILFNILPVLKSGVLIHFHDVFYPFEYPESWALSNRWHSWNEAYILRAFLMYNNSFEVVFWNSYCENKYRNKMRENFPLYFKGGSSSLWIQKK